MNNTAETNPLEAFLAAVQTAVQEGTMAAIIEAIKWWEKSPDCEAKARGREEIRILLGAPAAS